VLMARVAMILLVVAAILQVAESIRLPLALSQQGSHMVEPSLKLPPEVAMDSDCIERSPPSLQDLQTVGSGSGLNVGHPPHSGWKLNAQMLPNKYPPPPSGNGIHGNTVHV
jgi:hypothetical protein